MTFEQAAVENCIRATYGNARAFALENVACDDSEKSLKTRVPNPRDGFGDFTIAPVQGQILFRICKTSGESVAKAQARPARQQPQSP